ncbi:MAG: CotH kinase family protein [Bacteroidota bacterium]
MKLRLKGDWLDHLRGSKWSFRIKAKTDYAWNRLVTFSVQNPATRSYLDEWMFHQLLTEADILSPRYDFIELFLNEQSLGVYAYEEHFDKQLAEYKQRREGPIIKLTEDLVWQGHLRQVKELGEAHHLTGREDAAYDAAQIRPFKEGRTQANPTLVENFEAAQTLLHQLKFKQRPPADLVDMDRFARYFAIADVLEAYHGIGWHNVRFYYNPITSKLEPIGYDGFGETPTPYNGGLFVGYKINFERHPHEYFKHLFTDKEFFRKYIRYLDAYSQNDFLAQFLQQARPQLANREVFIQKEFTKYNYDTLKVLRRGKKLQALIRPYGEYDIKVRTQKDARGRLNLMVANHHTLPVEVIGFGKKGKMQHQLESPIFIYATPKFYASQFTPIPVERNYNTVFYRVAGLTEVYTSEVVNWNIPDNLTSAQQLFKNKPLVSNAIYQVEGQQVIFKKGNYKVTDDLTIPENYQVIFEAGCQLDLVNNAAFLCQSPVQMMGSADAPIRIFSSDGTANGFSILTANEKSILHFVQFDGLNTLQRDNWSLTGAVNFYESDVEFFNCAFINNHCEDALNTVRSLFKVENCKIANTFADGFDADFCEGDINNLSIEDTGNDAIDFSGSIITIRRMDIHRAGDKGISVGEESKVSVTSTYINGAQIGVASKDLSSLKINLVNMVNCETGFAGYQKKPEFGPATIQVKRYGAENVKQLYLLDRGSKLQLVDKEIIGE